MSKKKYTGFYNIVKNETTKEATIYIYGVIGGFDWDTYSFINTSNKFVQDFKETEQNADIIHVHINSPGGNIYDGMPIYNVLKNSKKTIYTYVDGLAASMASLIALAGSKVFGYRNSIFMVHNASTLGWGNSSELKEIANELDTYDKALGTIIEDKLNISGDDVAEKYLNYKDNYFTGDEALTEGFFDEIIKEDKTDIPEDLQNMTHQNMMKHYAKMNFAKEEVTPQTPNTNTMSKEIKAPSIQNVLGYETPFQANENGVFLQETEVETIENALTTANTNVTNITAERDAANTSVADANTSIEEALTTAEIEFTPEMSLTEKINLLEAQRKEFAQKTGGGKTTVVNDGDEPPTGAPKQKVYAHNEEAKKILGIN
jgi:ATP-dependent protease ClpP protease subunit